MRNRFYFSYTLFFLIAFSVFSSGQTSKIDSLRNILVHCKTDTTRINTLNLLATEIVYVHPDSSILFSTEALHIAEKSDWKKGIASSYNRIGWGKYVKGNYSEALTNDMRGLNEAEKIGEKNIISSTSSNIGLVYADQGNYPKALEYYLKALKIDEAASNEEGKARDFGNIGIVYMNQNDFTNALENYFKALKIYETNGNKRYRGIVLGNIGIVYINQKKYSLAFKYYSDALKISTELNDKRGIARNTGNIGNVYQALGDSAENAGNKKLAFDTLYQKALDCYSGALRMDQELKNATGIAIKTGEIGSLYLSMKKYKEAEKYLLQAAAKCDSIGALYYLTKFETALSDLYGQTGKFDLALIHYKKYAQAKDSLFNQDKTKNQTRTEMNFEFEKKQAEEKLQRAKEDLIATAELQKQKQRNNYLIAGFLLVLALAFFIFRIYWLKQKANLALEEKNQLIELQKQIVEQKNKDVLDSIHYAKHIQQALLPSEKYITRNLKRLQKD